MEIIQFITDYGIVAVAIGLLACMICGLIKVPIARKLRQRGEALNIDNKVISDRIRNICNIIVVTICLVFALLWHCITKGYTALLTSKLYTDILASFATAKALYMFYEGVGSASIKKFLANISANIAKQKIINQKDNMAIGQNIIDTVTQYLSVSVGLPLTDEQLAQLQALLNSNNIKGDLWKN